MPKKLDEVKLTPAERRELQRLTRKGEVRVFGRARILLSVDEGLEDAEVMSGWG